MNATIISQVLEKACLAVNMKGGNHCLPRHLIIAADNCTRETKNQWLATYGAFLVAKGHFESVEFQFMLTGHTKNELDQRFSAIATVLRKAPVLETPQEFVEYMTHNIAPTLGSELHCEVMNGTWDFIAWFKELGIQMKGLTATHLQPDSNHLWRFMLRKHVEASEVVECHNADWENLPQDQNDVVLVLKQSLT